MTTHFCSLNMAGLSSSQERFFQHILVSQLETVEAVSLIDKQCMALNYKIVQNENSINYLLNRVSVLEDSIKDMQNFITVVNPKPNFDEMRSKSDQIIDNIIENDSTQLSNSIINLYDSAKSRYPKKTDFFGKTIEYLTPPLYYQRDDSNKNSLQISPIIPNGTVKITNHYHPRSGCFCNSSVVESSKIETNTEINTSSNTMAIKTTEPSKKELDLKDAQREFNKHVKYEVNRKFGANYLYDHQVRELDLKKMHKIRDKVVKLFKPFPIPIKEAWDNAMNSLRQDRHQLKKKKRILK